MSATAEQLERFRLAVDPKRREINVAEVALMIAQDTDTSVNVTDWIAQIDVLALPLAARIPSDAATLHRVLSLNHYFFEELGFHGNEEQYYDPKNSLLNEVILRRTGIPITLSILYIEMGRRIGLKLYGVSFPGHFLVKLRVSGGELVLDPYSGGRALSEEDLRTKLKGLSRDIDPKDLPLAEFIEAAQPRDVIARLLRNLKAIYVEKRDWENALKVQHRMVILLPDWPAEVRDRGLMYAELECPRAAADDLDSYLKHAPAEGESEADDALRQKSRELRARAGRLH